MMKVSSTKQLVRDVNGQSPPLAITGDSDEPLAPLYNWLLKLKYEVGMWWKSLRMSA
jgi:hypothetical protein